MIISSGKDERLSEIVGYSALWRLYNTFEFYKDACYIAETPESLRTFKKEPNYLPEEKYETVEVSVSDVLEDFSFSNGWYAFEPGALEKFRQLVDSIGIECRITADNFESGPGENISRVHIQGPDYDHDPADMLRSILEDLTVADGVYKRESVDAAIEYQDEITPLLLDVLEEVLASPDEYDFNSDSMLPTYALMLLGHFKETKSHTRIIGILCLPDVAVFELLGDIIDDDIPAVLLRTSGGSFDEIKSLALKNSAWVYSRIAALKAMVLGVLEGVLERDEALRFLSSLVLEKRDDFSKVFLTNFARCVYDLYPEELMDTIEKCYAEDLIDNFVISLQEFQFALEQDKEAFLEERRNVKERQSLDDIHNAMSWWACFNDREEDTPRISSSRNIRPQKEKKSKTQKKMKSKKKLKKASRKKNRR